MYRKDEIIIDDNKWNQAEYDTMGWETVKHPTVDPEIEQESLFKGD